MMSNTSSPRGDVENAVLQLQQQLNSNYLAAEKLMSLRNPDESKLRDLSAKIDSAHTNLTEIIEQAPTHETSNYLERASKNKIEFDTYLSEFMQKQPVTSNYDDKSCSSICKRSTIATLTTSKSSRRSVKLLAVEAEYRAAQLKAKQAIERTEEETLIAKDEARLAMQKSQIANRSPRSGKRTGSSLGKTQCMERIGSSKSAIKSTSTFESTSISDSTSATESTSSSSGDCTQIPNNFASRS